MDYNKIGNFIMNERKKKKLTQAKLAEKLFVSEKTVSKWETGRGIPDSNILTKLCEILDVSLNELLRGEKMIEKNNDQKNEQLLLEMAKEIEQKNKIIWTSMWIIMIVSLVSLIGGVLVATFLIPEGIWQLITVIVLCILFIVPCFYALKLEVSVGSYKCKKCGCEIIPTYQEAMLAMHMGTTRHLKCPNCKKREWCKKVLKK